MNVFGVLTLVLALSTAAMALGGLWVVFAVLRVQKSAPVERDARTEKWILLLGILTLNLLIARVLSLPGVLFFLRDMVPDVRGAMCGYGVMQATPVLSIAVAVAKGLALGALVVALVSARANRLRGAAGLERSHLAVLAAALLLALLDASLDIAYVLADRGIDKVTCCETVLDLARFSESVRESHAAAHSSSHTWLTFYTLLSLAAAGSLLLIARRQARSPARSSRMALIGGAILGAALLPLGVLASMESLAPVVLHRPYHHCPIEVWTETVDGILLLALLVLGAALPLAACVLGFDSRRAEPARVRVMGEALRFAPVVIASVLIAFYVHLAVARMLS